MVCHPKDPLGHCLAVEACDHHRALLANLLGPHVPLLMLRLNFADLYWPCATECSWRLQTRLLLRAAVRLVVWEERRKGQLGVGLWLSPLAGYVGGQAMRHLAVGLWLSPLVVSGDRQVLRQLAVGLSPLVVSGD